MFRRVLEVRRLEAISAFTGNSDTTTKLVAKCEPDFSRKFFFGEKFIKETLLKETKTCGTLPAVKWGLGQKQASFRKGPKLAQDTPATAAGAPEAAYATRPAFRNAPLGRGAGRRRPERGKRRPVRSGYGRGKPGQDHRYVNVARFFSERPSLYSHSRELSSLREIAQLE